MILKSHRAIGAGRVRQGQIPLQSQRGVTGPVTPAGVEICLFPAESESLGKACHPAGVEICLFPAESEGCDRASHPCRCGDMFISCSQRAKAGPVTPQVWRYVYFLQSQRAKAGPVTPAGVEICLFPAEPESQGRASHPAGVEITFLFAEKPILVS